MGFEKDRFGNFGEILTELVFTNDSLRDLGEIEIDGKMQTVKFGFDTILFSCCFCICFFRLNFDILKMSRISTDGDLMSPFMFNVRQGRGEDLQSC